MTAHTPSLPPDTPDISHPRPPTAQRLHPPTTATNAPLPMKNTSLFTRAGWFCVPGSPLGWLLCAAACGFCVTVFLAVDRHSHSVSDTAYGVFPYFACTFLALDWIGRRSIEASA